MKMEPQSTVKMMTALELVSFVLNLIPESGNETRDEIYASSVVPILTTQWVSQTVRAIMEDLPVPDRFPSHWISESHSHPSGTNHLREQILPDSVLLQFDGEILQFCFKSPSRRWWWESTTSKRSGGRNPFRKSRSHSILVNFEDYGSVSFEEGETTVMKRVLGFG